MNLRLLVILAALNLSACDAGFVYTPVGWSETTNGRVGETFGVLDIRTTGIRGLSVSSAVVPRFEVTNQGAAAVVFSGGELRANGQSFNAEGGRSGDQSWRVIAPGASRNLDILWMFPGRARDTLRDGFEVILLFKEEERVQPVSIVFKVDHVDWGERILG